MIEFWEVSTMFAVPYAGTKRGGELRMAKEPVRITAVATMGFLVQTAFQAALALGPRWERLMGRCLRRATPDGS